MIEGITEEQLEMLGRQWLAWRVDHAHEWDDPPWIEPMRDGDSGCRVVNSDLDGRVMLWCPSPSSQLIEWQDPDDEMWPDLLDTGTAGVFMHDAIRVMDGRRLSMADVVALMAGWLA